MWRDAFGDAEQKSGRSSGVWAVVDGAGSESERGKGVGEGSDMYGVVYRCVGILNRGEFIGNKTLKRSLVYIAMVAEPPAASRVTSLIRTHPRRHLLLAPGISPCLLLSIPPS